MSAIGWVRNDAVLIVDLEEAINNRGSTLEAFWNAAATGWAAPLRAIAVSRNSRDLQRNLVASSFVAPARLEYCSETLTSIAEWRRQGGRVALVSGYAQDLTEKVALHLALFDAVYGDVGTDALRRENLARIFGDTGYIELRCEAPLESIAGLILSEQPANDNSLRSWMPAHLRLMRPHQWLKNLLLFVPAIAAHELTLQALSRTLLGFLALCLIASSTYILNDLLDLSSDRNHPRKRNRPLASGAVSLLHGTIMLPVLALAGIALASILGPKLLGMLGLYFLVTTIYSFKLKRIVVIDICTLAVLYTLRILAGSVAAGVPCSVWLLAFSIFLFFSLAAVKRQAELIDGVASGLVALHGRGYRASDLPVVSNIVTASGMVSVMVLALYINSGPVVELYSRPEMLWGICLVLLFWNSRIAILTQRGEMHDDPVVFAACDRVSQLCGAVIVTLALAATVPVSGYALALRYIFFAVVATLANLLVQRVVLFMIDTIVPHRLAYVGALGAGTIAGLFLKYVLDKRWIFEDVSTGIEAHGKRFSLYLLMGAVTTLVFWSTETIFWFSFHTTAAREIGGVLGLSVGYVFKYHLDRRFVFSTNAARLRGV